MPEISEDEAQREFARSLFGHPGETEEAETDEPEKPGDHVASEGKNPRPDDDDTEDPREFARALFSH